MVFQQYFTVDCHFCCLNNLILSGKFEISLFSPFSMVILEYDQHYRFQHWPMKLPWQHSAIGTTFFLFSLTLFPISLPIIYASQDLFSWAMPAQVPNEVFCKRTLPKVLQKGISCFTLIYNTYFSKTNLLPLQKSH